MGRIMLIRYILILLLSASVFAGDWTVKDGKREWHAQRTKVKVSHQLEMISWPGLPDSTYFKIDVGSITDSIWYDGDTTTIGISEYFHARFYNVGNNTIEWEAVLYQKPGNQYSWTFPIEYNNLTFHYHSELTQEEIDEGAYRPDSVVGSYAVYHSYKTYNEYRTGLAFYIYRPKVWDSAGDTVWLDIQIDTITNNLTINGTRQWFRDAVYPVTIDPTFGYTGEGGTEYLTSFGLGQLQDKYTATAGDTVISISLWGKGESASCSVYIYDYLVATDSPGDRIGSGWLIEIDDADYAWRTVSGLSIGLIADSIYCLAFINISSFSAAYDAGTTDAMCRSEGAMTDPFGICDSRRDRRLSIYATYTEGGAPPEVELTRRRREERRR